MRYIYAIISLLKYLREELNTKRIGTCLDTCHATISRKYMEAVYNEIGDIKCLDYFLESYFKRNKDYIYPMHKVVVMIQGDTEYHSIIKV